MLSVNSGTTVPIPNIKNNIHVPAAATAAVVTLAAIENHRHVVHNIQWSYTAAPTGGRLTVAAGAVTIFDVDIIAGGPGGFNLLLKGINVNEALVVTLASGAGAVAGKLNVQSSVM